MNVNLGKLRTQLILEEGLRLQPYDDVTGKPVPAGKQPRGKLTIGVGRNLDANPLSAAELAVIGHDARTRPITHEQAIMLLDNDINDVIADLRIGAPWALYLDEVRARVVADMCFNLGMGTLLKFKRTLNDIRSGNYVKAGRDMEESLWYKQVGNRAKRLVAMMQTGKDYTT